MQKNQRYFDSSYLMFLLALFFVVLWWYGLSLRSFILIDSEWRKKHFQILQQIREAWQEGTAHSADMLWALVRQEEITSLRSLKKKKASVLENFSLPSLSSVSASGHHVFLQTSLFRQTPACILNRPRPMGENLQLALPARRRITNPRGVFFFLVPPPIRSRDAHFKSDSRSCSFYTQTWCGTLQSVDVDLKESLWFPLVEQEVSFLTPSSVVTPVYVPVRCDTPSPPTPAKTPWAQIREKSFIYL